MIGASTAKRGAAARQMTTGAPRAAVPLGLARAPVAVLLPHHVSRKKRSQFARTAESRFTSLATLAVDIATSVHPILDCYHD